MAAKIEKSVVPKMKAAGTHEFVVLDGIRGVAAAGVMIFHYHQAFPGLLQSAYLAVDLFFVLSGFVIAHAYERRLLTNMKLADFLTVRLIRLWPLLILACALGFVSVIARSGFYSDWAAILGSLPNFFFLPYIGPRAASSELFPVDVPAWSLFFELIANFGYAFLVRRLSDRMLKAIVALAGILLVFIGFWRGNLGGGTSWTTIGDGLARVLFSFSFSLGILLYRRFRATPPRRGTYTNALLPVLVMGVVVAIFAVRPAGVLGAEYDVAFVLLLSPGCVWFGAHLGRKEETLKSNASLNTRLLQIYAYIGWLSYALYVLHIPLGSYVTALAKWQGIIADNSDPQLFFLKLTIVPLAAAAIAHFYDTPVRAWLTQKHRLISQTSNQ